MDKTHTARTARPLRLRLAAASPWSPGRIAGESVLTVVLAGLAGLFDAVAAGFGVRTVAVVAGIAALSLIRRALPATVLVVSACAAAVSLSAVPLLIYASWSAGSRIMKPGRTVAAYAAALVLNTALSAYEEIGAGSGMSLPVTGALSTGVFFVLAIVPGMMARYRAQRRSLLEAQRRNNVQLMREQKMVARQARLLERGRIAQDMHDSLGHQLVLISVHAGALQVDPDLTDRQREGVQVLRDASVAAMRELREAVGILHEDRDDRNDRNEPAEHPGHAAEGAGHSQAASGNAGGDAAGGGAGGGRPLSRAVASIDGLVASSRAAGTTVDVQRSGAVRPLAPAADHAAFRIAQEGLTNAHKHAPGAPITLALRYESDSLVVEVANGPAPAGPPGAATAISGGQGLTGLRERARLVGGMVHTGRTPDGGFRIAGMLPYGTGDGGPTARPDDATSVAPDSDFVGQPGEGAAGDSGADINLSDTQGEFAAIMSSKKNLAIGCAVTAVVLVLGTVALGVWGVSALMDEVAKATISPSVYEAAKVGDPEADVQDTLPEEDSFLTSDLENKGPRVPEGATCRHFGSDDPEDTSTIFRFCFDDGELVAKQTFQDGI
ncbi:histidine kinase [Streptomyces niveus]